MTESTAQHLEGRPRANRIGWALSLFMLSLGITGYDHHHSNQALQLPIVHLWNDPGLYPDDPFVQTLDGYVTVVWPLVAIVARALPLDTVLLVGFLAERFLIILAAGAAGAALFPQQRWAPIAAMAAFALGPSPFIGSGTLVETYFEQTGVAIVLLLFALAAFLKGNRFTWAILTGIAFNVNVMYTAYALTYFLAALLVIRERRSELPRWVLPSALFAAISLPTVVWAIRALSPEAVDEQLWVEISRARLPHHLFPHTVGLSKIWKHVALTGWLLAAAVMSRRRQAGLLALTVALFVVSLGWLGFAYVAAYIVPTPRTLVWHPMRGLDIWCLYLGVALAGWVTSELFKPDERPGLVGVFSLLVFLVIWSPHRAIRPIALAMLLLAVILPAAFRRTSAVWLSRQCVPVFVCTLVLLAGANTVKRYRETGEVFIHGPAEEVLRIAEWAREHTPRDSLFLTPPVDFIPFRSLSQRPTFCDHKDASAILWDFPYASEWNRRMLALGYDVTQQTVRNRRELRRGLDEAYEGLSDEDVMRLVREYSVDHWIVPVEKETSFPVVYETASHRVLAVAGDVQESGDGSDE